MKKEIKTIVQEFVESLEDYVQTLEKSDDVNDNAIAMDLRWRLTAYYNKDAKSLSEVRMIQKEDSMFHISGDGDVIDNIKPFKLVKK